MCVDEDVRQPEKSKIRLIDESKNMAWNVFIIYIRGERDHLVDKFTGGTANIYINKFRSALKLLIFFLFLELYIWILVACNKRK